MRLARITVRWLDIGVLHIELQLSHSSGSVRCLKAPGEQCSLGLSSKMNAEECHQGTLRQHRAFGRLAGDGPMISHLTFPLAPKN